MRGQMKNASSIHDNCFGKVIFHVSVLRYFECNEQHCNYIVKLRENGVFFLQVNDTKHICTVFLVIADE